MSNIRRELIRAAISRAFASIDYNAYNNFHEEYEFQLKNVENASQSWFEEAKSHLTLGNKNSEIVQCFEEEQKAFYTTRSYDFSISDNTSNHNQYISINFKDNDSKESSRLFKKLKMENVEVQNDYEREIMQQRSNISDNDEVQNNPNLHSE
ncbi:kinase-like domain-containing protein [Rhizophagus irregularis DAOM 181602=DAOM 197198]|nr:kinase-like domain-containing protein [Rhizophagus irregularis DAOM 181602=DAOM 197198]